MTAFGAAIDSFVMFDQQFFRDHGFEADIELRLVSNKLCALLDALGPSAGVEAVGLIELDRNEVRSGTRVSGVIQHDLPVEHVDQATRAGFELDGKGPPELYLIDGAGQIHDSRRFVRAENSSARMGGWFFAIPVTFAAIEQSETVLVVAVWNRPKQNQPSAFRTLPASQIEVILEDAGLFSLSAFKVLR